MSRCPYFQFFPADFIVGTSAMTAEGRGAYISLLCHAWESDGVPDDVRVLRALTCASDEAIAEAKAKFAKGEDGRLRNRRMEETRDKLTEYREAQSERAKKAWEKRKGEPEGSHRLATSQPKASHKLAIGQPQASHRLANGEPMPNQSQSQSQSQIAKPKPKAKSKAKERGAPASGEKGKADGQRADPSENEGGAPPAEIPTELEVATYGERAGVPEWYARRYWAKKAEADTWVNPYGRVIDWRRQLVRWYAEDGRPTQPKANGKPVADAKPAKGDPDEPQSTWEIKTALEAVGQKMKTNRLHHRAEHALGYTWDCDKAKALDGKLRKRKVELEDRLLGI